MSKKRVIKTTSGTPTPTTKTIREEKEQGEHLQTWVPPDLARWVESIAKKEDRSVSQLVRRILLRARDNPKAMGLEG